MTVDLQVDGQAVEDGISRLRDVLQQQRLLDLELRSELNKEKQQQQQQQDTTTNDDDDANKTQSRSKRKTGISTNDDEDTQTNDQTLRNLRGPSLCPPSGRAVRAGRSERGARRCDLGDLPRDGPRGDFGGFGRWFGCPRRRWC